MPFHTSCVLLANKAIFKPLYFILIFSQGHVIFFKGSCINHARLQIALNHNKRHTDTMGISLHNCTGFLLEVTLNIRTGDETSVHLIKRRP